MHKVYRQFFCLLFFLVIILSTFFQLEKVVLVFLIMTNFFLVLSLRKNIPLFIFSIFISFYTLALIPYFFLNYQISFFDRFNNLIHYDKALKVHSLFLLSFLFFIPKYNFNNEYINYLKLSYKNNNFLFYLFYLICVLVMLNGMSGENLFESGQYSSDLVVKSSLYEYFILFYLISFYYSSRKGFHIFLLISIYIIYCFKTLLYGGRIEIVQISIMLFLIYTVNNKIVVSKLKILAFLIFFYYFNVIVSNIRNNPENILNKEYVEVLNPISFINSGNKVIYSNEGEVFQSSSRLIGMADTGVLSLENRFVSLITFSISAFVPSNLLPPAANLISYKQDEITSGGGGLISAYFYVWFGWFGPLIISYFLIFILNKIQYSNNDLFKLYGIMILSTFPRWYSYNPIILFKLCFWVIPIVLTLNLIIKSRNFKSL